MTTDQVNYMNIGLMGISVVLAFILPFELFLFSYAFLGPLHYLTEISWLHDRQYFSPKKWDYIPLVVLSIILLLGSSVPDRLFDMGWTETLSGIQLTSDMNLWEFLQDYNSNLIFLAFGLALLFILTKNMWLRIYGSVGLTLVALLIGKASGMVIVFGVYTPTLIHVYLFTGAFILFGSLKSHSRTGYISFGVFILCALICLFAPHFISYSASNWALTAYPDTFGVLNDYMAMNTGVEAPPHYMLDVGGNVVENPMWRSWVMTSDFSLIISRFIAFAYTYHYLNWFSKTSIIKWHEVPKTRFAVVVLIWIASTGLYLYDYSVGFGWLFLLSFMHVLLEFPLNHQSFIGIGRELRKRMGGAST